MSVTQGEAHVYMNGHLVITFADKIKLIKAGEPFYGENIGGWASIIPDTRFIRGMMLHPYAEAYKMPERIGAVLDDILLEEQKAGEANTEMLRQAELERIRHMTTEYAKGRILRHP